MLSNTKNQCKVNCNYKIPNTIWKSFFRSKKPLCEKFQENGINLPIKFALLSKDQKAFFDANYKNHSYPKISENGLVIVETRKDKRLEIVLKNIAYYVPNWQLHIFHSPENKEFIKNILGEKVSTVKLYELKESIHTNQDYNKVLKGISFWEKLRNHERVLIFQTDSLMFRFGIEQFLKYDYIGAVWPWWGKLYDLQRMGGNGGFSIRKVSAMITIINKYNTMVSAPIRDYQNEDVFFCYHLYNDESAELPNWNQAMLFASESYLCSNTLGVHQAWKFHDNFILDFEIKKKHLHL